MQTDPTELVDIINANNVVTGQCSKQEAHQKGLLHRTVISEIINPRGEWLLVKQAGDKQDPGQYVSPVGGHVKAGETELAALAREAMEEAGITDLSQPKRLGQAVFNRFVNQHQENHLFILYEIHVNHNFIPKLNHESESCRWFTVDELNYLIKKNPSMFGNAFHFVFTEFYC